MCSMIAAVHVPRLPLLVALLGARRPLDAPVALGPAPGAPQVIGLCTPAAEAHGVRPGLRVGEALARCPELDLVAPDPEAAAEAAERTLCRLEAAGFAVSPSTWTEPPSTRGERCACTAGSPECCAGCGRRSRWGPTAAWAPPRRSSAPSRRPARPLPGIPW